MRSELRFQQHGTPFNNDEIPFGKYSDTQSERCMKWGVILLISDQMFLRQAAWQGVIIGVSSVYWDWDDGMGMVWDGLE